MALINRAMNRLTADGVLYFSNNYTRFEFDESLMARYDVKDITHETIGFDFDLKNPSIAVMRFAIKMQSNL